VLVWVDVSGLREAAAAAVDGRFAALVGRLDERRFLEIGVMTGRGADADWQDRPSGWENVTSMGMVAAQIAARRDLSSSLLAAIRGIETDDGISLGRRLDFVGANEALARRLDAITAERVEYAGSQVCVAHGRVTAEQLIQIFNDVAPPVGRDSESESLGERIAERLGESSITAMGYGAPPICDSIAAWDFVMLRQTHAWAAQTLSAVGRGVVAAGAGDEPQRRAMAQAAAKADALIRLARKIDELALPGGDGLTVGQYIAAHSADDERWSVELRNSVVSGVDWQGDICSVTMTLELQALWLAIAPGLDEWLWRRGQPG
jgi:hypothetical protein